MEFIIAIASLFLSLGFLAIITMSVLAIDDEWGLKVVLIGIWLVVAYLIYQWGVL